MICKKEPQSFGNRTQHSIDRGGPKSSGKTTEEAEGRKDRWMEVGEREDCEGGTGGWEKGNGSKEAHGEPSEEGDGVNKEERNGGGGGCVGGAGGGTE